jgi:hypothetical protein
MSDMATSALLIGLRSPTRNVGVHSINPLPTSTLAQSSWKRHCSISLDISLEIHLSVPQAVSSFACFWNPSYFSYLPQGQCSYKVATSPWAANTMFYRYTQYCLVVSVSVNCANTYLAIQDTIQHCCFPHLEFRIQELQRQKALHRTTSN